MASTFCAIGASRTSAVARAARAGHDPPMNRALRALPAALFLVAVACVVHACAGDGDGIEITCDSPLDCELGESCLDGVCTDPDAGEGEGEGGEGEGEAPDPDVINAVCQRLSACQVVDPSTCVNDLTAQIDNMRARGTTVCLDAADAMLGFFACANGLSCEQLQQDPFSFCPNGQEASNLQSQCFGGEGEGEGEGECEFDGDCPAGMFCEDGRCFEG
jgi:hypothetical protein